MQNLPRMIFIIIQVLLLLSTISCSDESTDIINDGDITDGDFDIEIDRDQEVNLDQEAELDQEVDLDIENTASPFSVSIDSEKLIISFANLDNILLKFPANGIQLGVVDQTDDEFNYDPWPLVTNDPVYHEPDGLTWLAMTKITVNEKNENQINLTILFGDNFSASMIIDFTADGRYSFKLSPDKASKVAFFRLRPTVDDTEGFYGLGEYFDTVNHRGKKRAMQIEIDTSFESGYNEAHVPVPFVTGSNGWGLFVECPFPGAFEVADEDTGDDIIQATFGTGTFSASGFKFHIFLADHPLDITKHYYDVTAYPSTPARWALGPWIWRDEVDGGGLPHNNQELVEYDFASIRNLDLPTTGYWIDRPYASGVNAFDFNDSMFPDFESMIKMGHDMGFRLALWHTPYVSNDHESSNTTKEIYAEAIENGYFPPVSGLPLNKWSLPIDFTNPDAYDWWQKLIEQYAEMGIEGFKMDYGEDIVPGVFGTRNKWKFFDGSDERTMHSMYQRFYHKVYAETLPADGGFLICRGGTYGDQANVDVIWPGDLDGNMATHGEVRDECEEGKKCVGGLPAAVIASISLGHSGFPYFGSDTGGYRQTPDKETYMRWLEHTALSSVMQVGTGSNDVPWEYNDENLFDDEVLNTYRKYARLHLRLWPYQWTYVQKIKTDGRPLQRALGMAYPELGEHPSDTYMFGDYLLVAPVIKRNQRERVVIFPAGKWLNYNTGEVLNILDNGQKITVQAALDTLPLFVMQGAIIPLLRPTIDAIAKVSESQKNLKDSFGDPLVDSYASTAGILYPLVFAGDFSSFEVFDGTTITQVQSDNLTTLTITEGEEFKLGTQFTLLAFDNKPSSIKDNDQALTEYATIEELDSKSSGWLLSDDFGGSLIIKVEMGEHEIVVTVK